MPPLVLITGIVLMCTHICTDNIPLYVFRKAGLDLLRKPFNNDAHQRPSTTVDIEDISHQLEEFAIAVHPVEVLSTDVDL